MASKNSNHIFSLWHGFVPLGLTVATPKIPAVLDRAPQAWMQHPVWYMKPIHVLLRLMGVKKIILGSSGHSGRDAADLLVDYLRLGYSTVINPDGPDGPALVLKKGILHLSLKSKVPIVPLRFSSSKDAPYARYLEHNTNTQFSFLFSNHFIQEFPC